MGLMRDKGRVKDAKMRLKNYMIITFYFNPFLETKKHIHKGEEINEILIQMHTTNSIQKSWQLLHCVWLG